MSVSKFQRLKLLKFSTAGRENILEALSSSYGVQDHEYNPPHTPTHERTPTPRAPHCSSHEIQMEQEQQGPSQWASGGINVSGEAPFEIRGFSLANAAAIAGIGVTAASFFEYFSTGGSGGLSGIGFVYGIPIMLVGLALKYAELPPAPLQTSPEAEALFEEKATAVCMCVGVESWAFTVHVRFSSRLVV